MDIAHDAIKGMAGAANTQLAFTSIVLGVFVHFAILKLPFEFELVMYHFIAVSIFAFFSTIIALVQIGENTTFTAFQKASLAGILFNTGILTSMSIYRLFFHRCRKFPGPIPAKLTRFYATYQSAKNTEYYKELAKMHEKYGDYVRTGPREISILRKEALLSIYGPRSECRKSSWYSQSGNDHTKVSINMTRDRASYKLRRRAWDRALSTKSIAIYEPKIKAKVDILIDKLYQNAGKPMDVTAWSMFLAFDIMGQIGFGKDFDNLTTGTEHPAIKAIHDHIKILGIVGTVPWLLNILGSIPGAAAPFWQFFDICAEQMKLKEKAWDSGKQPQDIASWLLKAFKEKDISASPTPQSLEDDSRVVIIAGSDTTSNTLACVLYYLAKHPQIQRKLQDFIHEAIPGSYTAWNYEKVKTITYIDDIIDEALRLKPPVVTIPPRETSSKGLLIGDTFIPGNVNVFVSNILIHRDPRWWKQPEEFIPERWGEKREEMGTDRAPYFPFNIGMHSCPGINLGYLSLRTSISSILQNFDISFAPGEDGETFDKRFLDTQLITLPPLKLQFTPRNNS